MIELCYDCTCIVNTCVAHPKNKEEIEEVQQDVQYSA